MTARRSAILAASLTAALAAPAAAQSPVPVPFPSTGAAATTPMHPTVAGGFRACVEAARAEAVRRGAPAGPAAAAVADVLAPDPEVIAASRVQPESRLAIWDYLAGLVDEERSADGAAAFLREEAHLRALGVSTGVDPATIAAIWGVETNFGRIMGKRRVIPALATLGCTQWRRTAFFRAELAAAIRVQAAGHVRPDHFVGSWAGAFGQTQFMPTSFWRLAVDGTGDGRADIIDEPRDALSSTANFLRRSGWVRGEAWGHEVVAPAGFAGPRGRTAKRGLNAWRADGFRRADGRDLPATDAPYGLIQPAGPDGPSFLVGRNFDAVFAYNPAEAYALAVHLLADRIKGGPGVIGRWPTDDPPLDRVGRREVQALLNRLGHDVGEPDGLVGRRTREALMRFQQSRGLVADGRAGAKALAALREAAARPTVP
jgi:lytic murein transglycosylase